MNVCKGVLVYLTFDIVHFVFDWLIMMIVWYDVVLMYQHLIYQ